MTFNLIKLLYNVLRSEMIKNTLCVSQIYHYLRQVNFTTHIGEQIFFDQNGDLPASFDIINWQVAAEGTVQFAHVGHFVSSEGTDGAFHIDMDRVVWGGGRRHEVCVVVSLECALNNVDCRNQFVHLFYSDSSVCVQRSLSTRYPESCAERETSVLL